MDKRILVIEDEEIIAEYYKKILQNAGYEVAIFYNGNDALQYYRQFHCPVVVTDLEMPQMSGEEVIGNIKEIDDDQVIVVVTSYYDPATIINIMKKNVYDYIVKPIEPVEFGATIKRAFESAEYRKMKKALEQERILKLERQIEWFNWHESIIQRNYDRVDRELFSNLHESFNQGAGFGSLLTLIRLIASMAKKSNGNYVIDEQMFELIKKNADVAEKILNIFSELVIIMNRTFEFEKVSVMELHSLLRMIIAEIEKYAGIKKMKIALSEQKPPYKSAYVNIESDYIKKAFHEIFMNALKFSKPSTAVMVFVDMKTEGVEILIINTPEIIREGVVGIPVEYENLLFEPFFRIAKVVYEEFETSDYGLGLTLVEKIVRKHGGSISIANILDSSDISRASETKVCVRVWLPLASEASRGERKGA